MNILELLGKYQVPLEQIGTRYKSNCPFPSHSDNTPSFVVYPETNSFYCFGCGKGGSVVQFIMYFEGISREEAEKKAGLGAGDLVDQVERILHPLQQELADFNEQLNFVVSGLARHRLAAGTSWSSLAPLMQKLDRRLALEKLTEQQAKEIVSDFQQH